MEGINVTTATTTATTNTTFGPHGNEGFVPVTPSDYFIIVAPVVMMIIAVIWLVCRCKLLAADGDPERAIYQSRHSSFYRGLDVVVNPLNIQSEDGPETRLIDDNRNGLPTYMSTTVVVPSQPDVKYKDNEWDIY